MEVFSSSKYNNYQAEIINYKYFEHTTAKMPSKQIGTSIF